MPEKSMIYSIVALHPEGVDRNQALNSLFVLVLVALHPEGVDRNNNKGCHGNNVIRSPSTRRAWIEISG